MHKPRPGSNGSNDSGGSSVSSGGRAMPRSSQSMGRPTAARPTFSLNAAARKGPASVSGFGPKGSSPAPRPGSGGRARAPPVVSRCIFFRTRFRSQLRMAAFMWAALLLRLLTHLLTRKLAIPHPPRRECLGLS
jgi:hypothetical protein